MNVDSILNKVSEFCTLNYISYEISLRDIEKVRVVLLKDRFEISTSLSISEIRNCSFDLLEFRLADCLNLLESRIKMEKSK